MSSTLDKIKKLSRRLYPTGRAFSYEDGAEIEKLHSALGVSEAQAVDDVKSILDQILPDNDNFTTEDAALWEIRLGLPDGSESNLDDRKLAITRKMNHPGDIEARQAHDYLQDQLQDAGFNVFVHENIPEVAIVGDPIEVGGVRCGQRRLAEAPYQFSVVNSIDQAKDEDFVIGDDFRSTFVVGGAVFLTSANVQASREQEFRQLILKVKPVQSVCLLFINFV